MLGVCSALGPSAAGAVVDRAYKEAHFVAALVERGGRL
jgi:hypothetical protein